MFGSPPSFMNDQTIAAMPATTSAVFAGERLEEMLWHVFKPMEGVSTKRETEA